MHLTVEISLYPLQAKYKKPIKKFIRALKKDKQVSIYTTAMSTYISGEYDRVMGLLSTEMKEVFNQIPASAVVIKLIPADLQVEKGFLSI